MLAVIAIVIPVGVWGFVVPVFVVFADPLVVDTFSVFIYIVFVYHGRAGNHAVFIQIVPVVVFFLPGVR